MDNIENVQDKLNAQTPLTTSKATKTPGLVATKKCSSKISTALDPLNWSFSFNQTISPNENNDIYQLLHGFEQNTWTSFDCLFKKLNDNTDAVSNVETL